MRPTHMCNERHAYSKLTEKVLGPIYFHSLERKAVLELEKCMAVIIFLSNIHGTYYYYYVYKGLSGAINSYLF